MNTDLRISAHPKTEVGKGTSVVLCASPSVRSISTDDGAALLHIDRGVCYSLNTVGAAIWEEVQGKSEGVPIDDILHKLEQLCQVTRTEIESDILEYIRTLESHGLLICNPAAVSPIN